MEKNGFWGIFELYTKLYTLSTKLGCGKKKGRKKRNKRLFCEVVLKKEKQIGIVIKNNYLKILIVVRKIQKTLLQKEHYGIINSRTSIFLYASLIFGTEGMMIV